MNKTVRNILAVIVGAIAGSLVNMGLIMISGSIIPPPEGVDNTTVEGLRDGIQLFRPIHFLFPFLAHALGTFVGAMLTAFIVSNRKILFAMIIGTFFLAGGVANVLMLPSPLWFTLVDLIGAYLPMAFLAGKLTNPKHLFLVSFCYF